MAAFSRQALDMPRIHRLLISAEMGVAIYWVRRWAGWPPGMTLHLPLSWGTILALTSSLPLPGTLVLRFCPHLPLPTCFSLL